MWNFMAEQRTSLYSVIVWLGTDVDGGGCSEIFGIRGAARGIEARNVIRTRQGLEASGQAGFAGGRVMGRANKW